jgi:hypothetical protein
MGKTHIFDPTIKTALSAEPMIEFAFIFVIMIVLSYVIAHNIRQLVVGKKYKENDFGKFIFIIKRVCFIGIFSIILYYVVQIFIIFITTFKI